MKHLSKKVLCLLMAALLVMPVSVYAAGGTFGISASSSTVDPGETFTVYVGGACCGRVDLSVSNGTLSETKIWVEDGNTSVSVTAGQSGSVTVTATPYEGFSDLDAELYEPGSRSVTVKIKTPVVEDDDDDEDDKPATKPDKDDDSDKNDEKKPSDSGSDSKKDNDTSSEKNTGSTSTESDDTESDDGVAAVEEDQDTEEDADKDEASDTDKAKDDKEEASEPVSTEEPVAEEPAAEKDGCIMHWIILVAAIAAAIVEFVSKNNKKTGMIAMAVYAVAAIILAVMGSCSLDWIFAIAGLAVLAVEFFLLKKKEDEAEEK